MHRYGIFESAGSAHYIIKEMDKPRVASPALEDSQIVRDKVLVVKNDIEK